MINKDAPFPLYLQVKDLLEEKVISGDWPKGYRIPTEKELAELFDVSTITVKRAVLDLVREGLLYRQRGKGTFVTSKVETDIQGLVTLKSGENENIKYPHRLVEFERKIASPLIAKELELNEGDEVYKLTRIKMNASKPVVLEYTYLVANMVPDLTIQMIQDELLYSIFQNEYNIELDQAKIYFSLLHANREEAELLEVPEEDSLFVIKRFTRTKQNELVEYSKFIVGQEDYQFYINVNI